MKKSVVISILLVGLVLATGLYLAISYSANEQDNMVTPTANNEQPQTIDSTPAEGAPPAESSQSSTGGYISYDSYMANKNDYQADKVVLFFNASWCPTCKALNSNITNNMNDIPEDVTIVSVDYDKNTELRKQYGVTTQHTLVYIDNEANQISKWSGGNTLESVLNQI